LSTQERIDLRRRNGRPDPATARAVPAGRGGDRLPRPPGRRRPGLAVIAVLLIVLGAAVAGLLALRIDNRVPVLVARREISVGHQISASDLAVAEIASSGVSVIRADQTSQVVGRYAITRIAPGRLLDAGMLGSSGLLTDGNAAVGIALPQGRYPASGLDPGDIVQVVRSVEGVGKVIADQAVVGTVQTPGSSVFGSSTSSNIVVTVVVSQVQSPAVAAAAAAQQVSLVLLRRGEPVGGG
jgi:hypothetical protein